MRFGSFGEHHQKHLPNPIHHEHSLPTQSHSVTRTVTIFFNTTWETTINDDTSESVVVCEEWDDNPDPDPTVPVPSHDHRT